MGFVIDYIVKTSDKRVSSYDTLKRFIDEREQDTFGEFEDHKSEEVSMDLHDRYAEDHPLKMVLGEFRTLTSKISIIKVDSSFSWMVHVMCTRWATY